LDREFEFMPKIELEFDRPKS